jgi:hypothetical protein
MNKTSERPKLEVADVVRRYGEAFEEQYGVFLTSGQRRVLRDVVDCRTAVLGGHVERCTGCAQEVIAYNSCRNRHCPKCQGAARARWLSAEAKHLLPVEYFHVVFTLPAELAALVQANPRRLYELLLKAARDTLLSVAADPHHLGAQPGILQVLHTWGQNLHFHPHVHAVVTGGGLSCDGNGQVEARPVWRACRPGFFLPVRILGRVFRGKFLAGVQELAERGLLVWPLALANAAARPAWLSSLYAKDWVVYAKRPFGGPEQVLKYLARYTHRVAISNPRLLKLEEGRVTFRVKDYADGGRPKALTLTAVEFLRRFVQHVLPRGFVKIRHYGLLANRVREQRLALARLLLVVATVAGKLGTAEPQSVVPPLKPERVCPSCGGKCFERRLFTEHPPAAADTS